MRRLALLFVLTLTAVVPLLPPGRAAAQAINRRPTPLPHGTSTLYYQRTRPAEFLVRTQLYYALQTATDDQLDQLADVAADQVGYFASAQIRATVLPEIKTALHNPQLRARAAYDLTFNGFTTAPLMRAFVELSYPLVGVPILKSYTFQPRLLTSNLYSVPVLEIVIQAIPQGTRPGLGVWAPRDCSPTRRAVAAVATISGSPMLALATANPKSQSVPVGFQLRTGGYSSTLLAQHLATSNPLGSPQQWLLRQQALLATQVNVQLLVSMLTRTDDDLRQLLQSPQSTTRLLAVQIIALKKAPVEADLIPLVADPQPFVAQAARALLVQLNQGIDHGPTFPATRDEADQAREKWQDWLTRRDELGVREATFVRQTLGRLAPPQQDAWLAVLREDRNDSIPLALALAIPDLDATLQAKARLTLAQHLQATRANQLAALLRDQRSEIRAAAAVALGQTKKKAHAPVLVGVLEDEEHPRVVEAARRALQALTGQDFGPPPRAPLAQRTAAVRAWRNWLQNQ
jgi:hypothetical protein